MADNAAVAYVNGTAGGLPPSPRTYWDAQDAYTFGSYGLALDVSPSSTYWVEDEQSELGYPYGRVRFAASEGQRLAFAADVFVLPSVAAEQPSLVVDSFDLLNATKINVGGCVVCAAVTFSSRAKSASASGVPFSGVTQGTFQPPVPIDVSAGAWMQSVTWYRANADLYTRGLNTSGGGFRFAPSQGWQYSTANLVTFAAWWKSASLPAGVSWTNAFELFYRRAVVGSASSAGLAFASTATGTFISVPQQWQSYNDALLQGLQPRRWASAISFQNMLQFAGSSGPFLVAGYTPASEQYAFALPSSAYSFPFTLVLS